MKILKSITIIVFIVLLLLTMLFGLSHLIRSQKEDHIDSPDKGSSAGGPSNETTTEKGFANDPSGNESTDGQAPNGTTPDEEPKYNDFLNQEYRLTDLPEFVSDISACTDPEKQYVLPDGYLYAYKPTAYRCATNQLPISTDTDGSVYNGIGYKDNSRIRGILEIADFNNSFVTGFIPIQPGDIIYFSGNCFYPKYESANVMNIEFYNSNKQAVAHTSLLSATESFFDVVETNSDGYISAVKAPKCFVSEDVAYVKFTLVGSGEQQFISVNQPLDEYYNVFSWSQIEKYISPSWYEEIETQVDKIKNIELPDESKAIKFIFSSDIHLDPYSTDSYTQNIGKVCAEVMHECKIPFYIDGGDNCTQSSGFMPSDFKNNIENVLSQLAPIPRKNLLFAVGNHDGATGSRVVNGETIYYRFQLNNQERSSVFFDWQRETNENKKFDSDGTYYYLDDPTTQTRYIILNPFWSQWAGDADGFVPNIQHSFFHTPLFGSKQLKWFAQEALNMPDNYAAVIIAHHVYYTKDFEIFRGIVNAFSNRTAYTGSYVGVEEWQSTSISVDYTNANSEIIAIFQGHNHLNVQYDYFEKVPCINITTTGAYWDVRDKDAEKRIKNTSNEFAVDVVVIDRVNRKIYMTRLGAGEDRVIEY